MEPGSGCFQYTEDALVSQGRNTYHAISKGGVLRKGMKDHCGMEVVRFFIQNNHLVHQSMIEDVPEAQDSHKYPRVVIQESEIQPICSLQYEYCD